MFRMEKTITLLMRKIYKSANPNYDPAVDKVGDFCYWNIPPVDSAEFTVARKLLLNATK